MYSTFKYPRATYLVAVVRVEPYDQGTVCQRHIILYPIAYALLEAENSPRVCNVF